MELARFRKWILWFHSSTGPGRRCFLHVWLPEEGKSQSWNTLLLMVWINTPHIKLDTYYVSINCIGLYKLITRTCIASSHIIVQLLVLSIVTLSTLHRYKPEDFTLWKIFHFACGNDSFCTMDLLHHRTTKWAPGLQQFCALFWWKWLPYSKITTILNKSYAHIYDLTKHAVQQLSSKL